MTRLEFGQLIIGFLISILMIGVGSLNVQVKKLRKEVHRLQNDLLQQRNQSQHSRE